MLFFTPPPNEILLLNNVESTCPTESCKVYRHGGWCIEMDGDVDGLYEMVLSMSNDVWL